MLKLITKVNAMQDTEIMKIWRALTDCDLSEWYDQDQQISMEDWANLIYSERSKRGLPLY